MKTTISVLVENHAGVLSRISGLFSRRGYNIDSLAVGITDDPTISRITIVSESDEHTTEQIEKQLNKLIDVIKVRKLDSDELLACELVLIKVSISAEKRDEIMSVAKIMKAQIVDVTSSTVTLKLADDSYHINSAIEMLKPYGIIEIVRTGTIALQKGSKSLSLKK